MKTYEIAINAWVAGVEILAEFTVEAENRFVAEHLGLIRARQAFARGADIQINGVNEMASI